MLALSDKRSTTVSWEESEIRRHTWKWVILGVLTIALLSWLFHSQLSAGGFDWAVAWSSFTRLRWSWIWLSLVPIFGTYYGRALRWAVFLRPLKPRPRIWGILSATIIGFTAITLFGRPGEFVRPYLIARKEDVPVTSQFAAWVLERMFDLLMALLVFGFALTQVERSGIHAGPRLSWVLEIGGEVVAILCTVVTLILLCMRHFAEPLGRRIATAASRHPGGWLGRVERLSNTLVQGVRSTRSDGAMIAVFAYSLIEWVLICACYWCVALAFQDLVRLRLVDVLILMGFVSFGAIIQIPGVGGGIQVVAVVALTELFGLRVEIATALALFLWFLTFVAIVPAGLFLCLKEGLSWRNLRRIGREAAKQ